MNSVDSTFQRSLCKLLGEIFDGPPGNEAYLLNPGDAGLLNQLETIDARTAALRYRDFSEYKEFLSDCYRGDKCSGSMKMAVSRPASDDYAGDVETKCRLT
jgi:hypothetical protein